MDEWTMDLDNGMEMEWKMEWNGMDCGKPAVPLSELCDCTPAIMQSRRWVRSSSPFPLVKKRPVSFTAKYKDPTGRSIVFPCPVVLTPNLSFTEQKVIPSLRDESS